MNMNELAHDSPAPAPVPAYDANAHIPSRAPSRAGCRRPPLVRSISSRDLLQEIPPSHSPASDLKLTIRPPYVRSSSSDSDSDDDDEDEDEFKPLAVALPPLCPPSPISPTSSISSGSDSDLPDSASPSSSEEDLLAYPDSPAIEDFPLPPPRIQPAYAPPTPAPAPPAVAAPIPVREDDAGRPPLIHHGLSRSALATVRDFWNHRYHLWQAWLAEMEHLDALQAECAPAYPAPPSLPSSRSRAQQAQGGPVRETRARVNPASPYAPVFPRMGDLRALREPFCDWPDRAFLYHPTYSIAKTLYVHDMLERARRGSLYALDSAESMCTDSPALAYCEAAVDDTVVDRGAPIWETDWRARWQVMIDQQPYPPQPYPVPLQDQEQEQQGGDITTPVHGWSAPYVSDPSAVLQELQYPEEDDEGGPFVWQPASAGEGEDACTQDAYAGAVQGWRADEREDVPAPVVRLPGNASYTPAPSAARSLADELARIVAGEADEDGDDEGELPPRPSSPAPRFFFHEIEDEDWECADDGDGDLGVRAASASVSAFGPALCGMDAVVSTSVRPVSC